MDLAALDLSFTPEVCFSESQAQTHRMEAASGKSPQIAEVYTLGIGFESAEGQVHSSSCTP